MKAAQHRYFKSFTAEFARSLKEASSKPNKKNVHALRVAIKKMHALFLFLEYVEPGKVNSKKAEHKIKKLFAVAGKLRTGQMRKETLAEFNHNKKKGGKELKKIRQEIKQGQKDLQQHIENFRRKNYLNKIERVIKKGMAKTERKALPKKINVFVIRSVKAAIQDSGKHVLHQARKHLKDAHYLLETLLPEAKARTLLHTLAPLEKKIGQWHDLRGSVHFIKKVAGKKALHKVKQQIAKLESETQSDFKQLKNKVLQAV